MWFSLQVSQQTAGTPGQTSCLSSLCLSIFAPKQDKLKMVSWVLASQLHELQGGGADAGYTGCTLPRFMKCPHHMQRVSSCNV